MIKKIKINQVRLGMFVHDLDLGWMDHPFLTSQFKLTTEEQLKKILSLKLQEVYIDTDKGLDIATGPEGRDAVEVRKDVEKTLETLVPYQVKFERLPLKEEWQHATKVKQEASRVVTSMMNDARLGKQIDVERLDPVVDGLMQSVFQNQNALLGMMRIRNMDQYTFEHSVSVAVLLASFGKAMGFDHDIIRLITTGGLLHDIGKTMVPLAILNKPGKLSDDEFVIMRRHVEYSEEVLASSIELPEISRNIIFEHHERFDGSGYPSSKQAGGISTYGKMAAVVDVYDALTSNRCYHKGKSPHWVLGKLIEWSKYHFQPDLVQQFVRCVGIYPIGTLVLLQSGRLGVVVESNDADLLRPIIKLVYDKKKGCHLSPTLLNLASQLPTAADKIVGSESTEDYRMRMDILLEPR